jgi:transposase
LFGTEKALVAVARGKPFTEAAQEAELKSGDGVSKLVKRFNARGLAALSIAAGAGRKPTYTSVQHARIIAEVQREPDRKEDQTATRSLMTLRAALRKTDLPEIAAETIRGVLHEAGYSYQRTRTWVRIGYALRVRKIRNLGRRVRTAIEADGTFPVGYETPSTRKARLLVQDLADQTWYPHTTA